VTSQRPTNERESPYLELAKEILTGLDKVRRDAGAWIDSESEELERETQAFKVAECLRPFYLAAHHLPNSKEIIPLPIDILSKDTEAFFRIVKRDGFFPSPYSPIPGATDQYIDFASFVLEFCALAYDFWQGETPRGRLVASAKELAQTALAFLLKPEHRLSDEEGCRWGGTSKFSRFRKTNEIYTDCYFTSNVILALHNTLEHPVLGLPLNEQDEIRNIIRQAGKWIAHRFDGQFITGDEGKTNRALLHSTWGLRALAETYHTQEPSTRKIVPSLCNAYLDVLQARLESEGLSLQQEYLTILSEDVDAPLYYEDRSALGGILITLALLRDLTDIERLLEELSYNLKLEQVLNSIMMLRNPATGLWYRQGLILSIHSYLTEAFLLLHRRGKGLGRKIEISGHMVRTAVREIFSDETILAGLQEAIYQRLLRIVDNIEKERAVQSGIDKLLLPPPEPSRRRSASTPSKKVSQTQKSKLPKTLRKSKKSSQENK
jgi:hypothetical protein